MSSFLDFVLDIVGACFILTGIVGALLVGISLFKYLKASEDYRATYHPGGLPILAQDLAIFLGFIITAMIGNKLMLF
jgi:hypothetical protein